MNSEKHVYLESLIEWGEEVKNTLRSAALPEANVRSNNEQLENWQQRIKQLLNEGEEINDEDMRFFQTEGEGIASGIAPDNERKEMTHIPFGEHRLPPLPYAYNALEPYISEEIMRLHHDKHHKSYVEGLNEAEKELYKDKADEKIIKHWLRNQAFNGSGHFLHTIFWYNMTPDSSKEPTGEIRKAIEQNFTSWPKFKNMFTQAASSVEGVGWAVLVWEPRSGRLGIQTFEKHQMFQLADTIPLLVLDMWEHAYYLQYKTDKKSYIKNWWNVVNWQDVNQRYSEARNITWPLF